MPTVALAFLSVFSRILASVAIFAFVFVFALILGGGNAKGVMILTSYALLSWVLLPLYFVNGITTFVAATIWTVFGISSFNAWSGLHVFAVTSAPPGTPWFGYWLIVSFFSAIRLIFKAFKIHAQREANATAHPLSVGHPTQAP